MRNITIIGTGLAGYTFAKEFRKLDPNSAVTIFSLDNGAFYSKPLLSNAVAKNKQADQIASATALQMSEQISARIIAHARITYIDTTQKTLRYSYIDGSSNNETLSYDELVLCLGAEQRDAGLGSVQEGIVHSINDLTDYRQFREKLAQAQNISIVGTGLIGCEFANDIVAADKNVTLVGPGPSALGNILPQQIGDHVVAKLKAVGVNWRLGVKAVGLESDDRHSYQLKLSDGGHIETDLVLTAIGLLPRIKLAEDHGIKVNKGIVVDQFLQTSVENIYALGDCAEIDGNVMPFVLPIMHSARILAANLTNAPEDEFKKLVFPYMPIIVKTPACSVVAVPPDKNINGEWKISEQDDDLKGLFFDANNQLQGFVLTGSTVAERQGLIKKMAEYTL